MAPADLRRSNRPGTDHSHTPQCDRASAPSSCATSFQALAALVRRPRSPARESIKLSQKNRRRRRAVPTIPISVRRVEITESRSIDVQEIDAASNTGVDNVREAIIASVGIAPARDRYKVFIIDEVHMLSGAAQRAAQDSGRAATARSLHHGHDGASQSSGNDPVTLPAV